MIDTDFLSPEEYPSWHPAAQGVLEDRPEGNTLTTGQKTGTPYTGSGASIAGSAGTRCQDIQAQDNREQAGTHRRRGNTQIKKGFRRPPARYATHSPFVPAVGASSENQSEPLASKPRNVQLSQDVSSLSESASNYELLVQGVNPIPDVQGQRKPEFESETSRAKNIVLNQLAAAPKSRAMLERKLQEKGISAEVIEDILSRFEAVNLINDAEFAEMFVRSRSNVKKLSRSAIRRELKARGVESEQAEIALEQRTEEDERADAHELVRKKLRPSMNLVDSAERNKITRRLVAMLGRKGYSAGLAFSVVREEVENYAQEMGMNSEGNYSYWE